MPLAWAKISPLFRLEWGPAWARGGLAISAVNLDSAVAALSIRGPRFSQGCGLTRFLTNLQVIKNAV